MLLTVMCVTGFLENTWLTFFDGLVVKPDWSSDASLGQSSGAIEAQSNHSDLAKEGTDV